MVSVLNDGLKKVADSWAEFGQIPRESTEQQQWRSKDCTEV